VPGDSGAIQAAPLAIVVVDRMRPDAGQAHQFAKVPAEMQQFVEF